MKVCLDVQPAIAQRAGVGRYTLLLAQHLWATADGDELILFYFDFRRNGALPLLPGARARRVGWCPGRAAQWAWKTLRWPPADAFAGRADLYHFPNFILPPLRRGKAVVTIHDASFLRYPQFAEERNLRYLTARIRDTVRRADAIVTDSAFSARELADLLGVEAGRLFPIHLGVAGSVRPAAADDVAAARRRLGLARPYLLAVGTIEPRKNLTFLVEVFERLAAYDGDLVVAGSRGWKCEPILARFAASPRADRIRVLNYVAETDLAALYTGADALLQTSFYEGFGLPPLEAMTCGTPVVSSAGGALPEVLGDAAAVLDAFDADAWAGAVRGILDSPARRARLSAAGQRHAAGFTWERTARRTWDVYRKVCA